MVVVVLIDQLEVFNRRLVDTPIKVEHKRLNLFIPLRRFVKEEHYSFRVVLLELLLQ